MRTRMKERKRGRPKSATPKYQFALRLDPAVGAALAEAVKRSRRTTTEEIRIAIENHLQALGLWPPLDSSNGHNQS